MSNLIIINDDNYLDHVQPVINGKKMMTGFKPRDYDQPVRMGSPFGNTMPLIPREEWSERIADMVEQQSRLSALE